MKSALFLALFIATTTVAAQQAPAGGQAPRAPENERRPTMAPPMAAPPLAAQPTSAERTEELLRAQTAAIRSLAGKLDSLEERIGRIERRQP